MLYTNEIEALLKNNNLFEGVFACDRLPFQTEAKGQKLRAYVMNTDTHDRPGTHWVVVLLAAGGTGEYFDSFGTGAKNRVNAFAMRFLNKHAPNGWLVNRLQLQHPLATSCGFYCVDFIDWRAKGRPMKTFVEHWSKLLYLNELHLDHHNQLRANGRRECLQ